MATCTSSATLSSTHHVSSTSKVDGKETRLRRHVALQGFPQKPQICPKRFPVHTGSQRGREILSRQSQISTSATLAPPASGSKPGGSSQMLVYVPPHPLIKHWIAVLRNESTPGPTFRAALAELGRLLIYEAVRDWLPTIDAQIQTPCGVADVSFVDPREPVKVVPILRAGLVLTELANTVLPAMQTYHLGFARNEETLKPSMYLNKLPDRFPPGALVLVADPMLATGGTIIAALEEIKGRGADPKLMRLVCAVAAPPALKLLSEKFPGLKVYAGTLDPELDERGFIVPGLGDAGDRSYGT